MTILNKDFVFDSETAINKQEIESLLSFGVELSFLLIEDYVTGGWFVKVSASNGRSGYLMTARGEMKNYSSLDTAVRQLSALCPKSPMSIHRLGG